jgi:hypothetical protein
MAFSGRIIFLVACSLASCSSKAQTDLNDNAEFFNIDNFGRDTLYIKSRFIECGEWGGHLEISKIYVKDNEFHITYEKFFADCNTIVENNGEPRQTLVRTQSKKLFDKDRRLVRQYFHQLVDAKFREPEPMHVGYIFEIKRTGNDINLHVYTWGSQTKEEYIKFIKQLFQ